MFLTSISRPVLRLAVVFLALVPTATALGPATVDQTLVDLTRPAGSPDQDARGTLRLWTNSKQGRHRFELRLQDVDGSMPHEFYVQSHVTDQLEFGGYLAAKGPTKLEYKADTKNGDMLPLGEQDNTAFQGCTVEVHRDGVPILSCVVPVAEPPFPGDPEMPVNTPVKVKLRLMPSNIDRPSPKMRGVLKLRSYKKKPKQLFRLKARRVPFEQGQFFVYIEDAPYTGTFSQAGELEQRGTTKRGRLRRNTRRGEPLPVGIYFLSQLAGRIVEVRDEQGMVYLAGRIPAE